MSEGSMFRKGFLFGTIFGFVLGSLIMMALVAVSPEVKAQELPSQHVVQQEDPRIECPEGYRCIPEDVAREWREILEHRQCMDDALDDVIAKGRESEDLTLTFDEYHVIITRDNQVFDKDELKATLTWCDYKVTFITKPSLSVSLAEEEDDPEQTWGFRLRVRLGATFWPLAITDPETSFTSPVLLVEPFFIHDFHIATYGGLDHFGVVAGVDLTENLNVFGGVGATWRDASLGPVLGLSLSFN